MRVFRWNVCWAYEDTETLNHKQTQEHAPDERRRGAEIQDRKRMQMKTNDADEQNLCFSSPKWAAAKRTTRTFVI